MVKVPPSTLTMLLIRLLIIWLLLGVADEELVFVPLLGVTVRFFVVDFGFAAGFLEGLAADFVVVGFDLRVTET